LFFITCTLYYGKIKFIHTLVTTLSMWCFTYQYMYCIQKVLQLLVYKLQHSIWKNLKQLFHVPVHLQCLLVDFNNVTRKKDFMIVIYENKKVEVGNQWKSWNPILIRKAMVNVKFIIKMFIENVCGSFYLMGRFNLVQYHLLYDPQTLVYFLWFYFIDIKK
jgi:hypothetical protein